MLNARDLTTPGWPTSQLRRLPVRVSKIRIPSQKVPSFSGLPVKSGTFTSIPAGAIDAFLCSYISRREIAKGHSLPSVAVVEGGESITVQLAALAPSLPLKLSGLVVFPDSSRVYKVKE